MSPARDPASGCRRKCSTTGVVAASGCEIQPSAVLAGARVATSSSDTAARHAKCFMPHGKQRRNDLKAVSAIRPPGSSQVQAAAPGAATGRVALQRSTRAIRRHGARLTTAAAACVRVPNRGPDLFGELDRLHQVVIGSSATAA